MLPFPLKARLHSGFGVVLLTFIVAESAMPEQIRNACAGGCLGHVRTCLRQSPELAEKRYTVNRGQDHVPGT